MTNIAVIINARLASTRLPKKLVKPFANTTLLDIALGKLSQIEANEKYLAAADDEIISIWDKYKDRVDLLERNYLSVLPGEHPHSISFEHYNSVKSSHIMIMNPCLPFTSVVTYQEAIVKFIDEGIISMTSVVTVNGIYFDNVGAPVNIPDPQFISTRSVIPLRRMAHLFHIINRDRFCKEGKLWEYKINDPYFFEVDESESLDVDNALDFEICECLYKSRKNY